MISHKTPKTRVNELPKENKRDFQNDNGKFPKIHLNLRYVDEENVGGEVIYNLDAVVISPWISLIDKHGHMKIETKSGWVTIDKPMEEDFKKIRNMLIEIHSNIDKEIEKFKKNHPQSSADIPYKNYKFVENDDQSQILKYNNAIMIVPNTMVDDVTELIEKGNFSPDKLKRTITQRNKSLMHNNSVAFNDPLNRSSLESSLSSRNLSISRRPRVLPTTKRSRTTANDSVNSSSIFNESSPVSASTPKRQRRTQQKTMEDFHRKVKDPSQSGKGMQWDSI